METYTTWESSLPSPQPIPAHLQAAIKTASSAAAMRVVREMAIAPGEDGGVGADQLAGYTAYVQLEKAQGNPARVQVCRVGGVVGVCMVMLGV